MSDLWVEVKGFPDYVMTRQGEVFNIKLQREVVHRYSDYLFVILMKNGKQYNRAVRKLIQENFDVTEE